jgi:hypothetical protein
MLLFIGEHLETGVYDDANINKAKKWVMWYHWLENNMLFQNLIISKLVKRKSSIEKVHQEICRFGEMRTLAEIKFFFWHDKIESITTFVKNCEKCPTTK